MKQLMNKLDKKFVWYYWLKNVIYWVGLIWFLLVYFYFGVSEVKPEPTNESILSGVRIASSVVVVVFILSYIWARLVFNFYRYELNDSGFQKAHGVFNKKYVTIPYERIQNIDITRGILQRIFGLSTIQIQTAGQSTPGSEGYLPGLAADVAQQLREELTQRAHLASK